MPERNIKDWTESKTNSQLVVNADGDVIEFSVSEQDRLAIDTIIELNFDKPTEEAFLNGRIG